MNRDLIHVLLNTTDKNNRLERSLLQGSTNKTFVLSLLDNEKLVKLDSSVAEVSVAVLYNPRMINSKLVYDGSYIETKADTGYDITISDETLNGVDFSMINIPFKEEFVTYAGNCKLIIRVESNGINMYTYSMDYTVDLNEGYFSTSIPNNLPKFEDVKKMVTDVQTALNSTNTKVSTNTNEIASAKADIATRAKADLSNVGDFSSSPDGAILYKKDGQLKSTGLTVLGDVINASGKRLQVDEIDTNPNTLNLGKNISVHENGGFIEYHTNTLNKDFLLMDYENDPINGTQKPIYYKRGTKQNVIIQSAETTLMSDVRTINIPSVSIDRQIQIITMNFNKALNNFCMEFVVNGKPVAYYPSLNAWNGLESGYTIVKGRNNLQLKPFFSSMKEYSYKINIKGSSTIDLMGNGVLPYYSLTFNEIDRLNVALEEDISPEKTRDSLQTLTGDARLDSSAIKNLTASKTTAEIARDLEGLAVGSKLDYTKALDNLPNIPSPETGDTVKTKLESLIGNGRLDSSAIKNLPQYNTAEQIRDKLISLPQGSRLGIEDLDNVESTISGDYIKTELETLTGDYRLDSSAIKNLPSGVDLSNYSLKDLTNVIQSNFDSKLNASKLYQELKNRVPARVNDVYKYYEEMGSVDFTTLDADIIHVVYQITVEGEVIQQTLPSTIEDKIIFVEIIYSKGITNGSVIISPDTGEMIDGTNNSVTLEGNKAHGVFFPENLNWDYIPFEELSHNFGITIKDGKLDNGGVTDITVENIDLVAGAQSNELTMRAGVTFEDESKNDFFAGKIQSLDNSIRISKIADGVCDLAKGFEDHNEGILAFVGNDQVLNSKYGKSKLYFGDIRVKGGTFVYQDLNTKSFVIQDTDPQDDPNVSGGTTFIIGLYYEPDPSYENTLTQDGSIELELVDGNDIPIIDVNGNPMGNKIDYKAGDKIGKEIYFGEVQAKAYTEVHLKIKMDFATEEMISVGSNTCILLQSTSKKESGGLALLSFMAYTGYRLEFDTKYYGFNSLNLSRTLVFPEPETLIDNDFFNLGQNLYLDVATKAKVSIQNYELNIKDNGTDIPVWNLTKFYNTLDSHYISGKQYKVTATLTDKDDAFEVALLHYTGTDSIPERPKVLSYNNSNPVFTTGWEIVDSMFITEDVVSGEHKQSKTFTIPNNSKGIAIIMYAVNSQIPMTLKLKDLEGDITPWFNKVIIKDNSHISEKYMEEHDYIYRSIVKTPSGISAYRYTSNSTDTKVPIGNVSGGDNKIINDNSWTDAGSDDPQKVQGDLKFLTDGSATINYTMQCYNEQSTLNQVQFWLAKVNGDGTFTEVPNSKIATTIEANRVKPKMVSSPKFTFEVNQNDSYRMFMKSDKDDGFFIESKTDGVPMVRFDIEFDEITEFEQNTLDKLEFLDGEIVITQEAQDAGISTAKLADDSVTKEKINVDVAGNGLGQNLDGSLEVNVDDSTVEISADTLQVKDGGITEAKLDSAVTAKLNTGYAETVGDGVATSFTITHNLGTLDVIPAMYRVDTGECVQCNVSRTNTNTITVGAFPAPATNNLRVLVKAI